MQRQQATCRRLGCDVSQTISSEEIKYADLPVDAAGDDSQVDESQRVNLPAETVKPTSDHYDMTT